MGPKFLNPQSARNMRLEVEQNANGFTPVNSHQPSEQEKFAEYLNAGIKAAQSGDRKGARQSLMSALDIDPKSENAWLWLASISEYPEELLVFLNNVLDINPKNERALQWSASTKLLLSKTLVQRGVDAHENGRREFAVQCFDQALSYDMHNVSAWLWLAALTDDETRRLEYFRRVLEIDPDNETAKAAVNASESESRSALYNVAAKRYFDGDHAGADQALDKLLERWPEDKDSWVLKSQLASTYAEKLSAWSQLLEVDPQNAFAVEGLSMLGMIEAAAANANENVDIDSFIPVDVTGQWKGQHDEHSNETEDKNHVTYDVGAYEYVQPAVETASFDVAQDPREVVEPVVEEDFSKTQVFSANDERPCEVEAHAVFVDDNDAFASIATDPVEMVVEPEQADERLKILVVENNPTARRLMAGKLENAGYTVFCAETGREAIDFALANLPSLVLADISMPGMDGYAICRTLRDNDQTQQTPVVLISGKDAWYDEDLGQAAGASGFITKPFGPETLMKTVQQHFSDEAVPN
jgi:CheY-like chemotaxis protein/Tfp pilus assembly protein PilF